MYPYPNSNLLLAKLNDLKSRFPLVSAEDWEAILAQAAFVRDEWDGLRSLQLGSVEPLFPESPPA
jgi:hypothetical protein